MTTVRWIGFSVASPLVRTLVHFLPAARTVTSPYGGLCQLSLLRPQGHRTVALDGARLNSPDGICVVDAFPELKEDSRGVAGLVIELGATGQRIDGAHSLCTMELQWPDRSVLFQPARREEKEEGSDPPPPLTLPVIRDAFLTSSLVVVNAATEPAAVEVSSRRGGDRVDRLVPEPIAGGGAREFEIPAAWWEETEPQECSWGLMRGRAITWQSAAAGTTAAFILLRDPSTKRIVSVVTI